MKRDIGTLLKNHRQLRNETCSASAYEFLAKLHSRIADNEFPLQSSPTSDRAGFEFQPFLERIGFTGAQNHQPPLETLETLARETSAERFPLVSILTELQSSTSRWHIVVAVPIGVEVALVDPASQQFLTRSSDETLKLFQRVTAAIPARPDIHFLTYRRNNS
jgi:hypothetical protein